MGKSGVCKVTENISAPRWLVRSEPNMYDA